MDKRNVAGFNFVRRQSETSLHRMKQDHSANSKFGPSFRAVHRSGTFTPRDVTHSSHDVTAKVTLPERFQQSDPAKRLGTNTTSVSAAADANSVAGLSDIVEDTAASIISPDVDWTDRKLDMQQAIHWVKQELVSLY